MIPFKQSSSKKSSVEQIRLRFDQDVERFSNLSTGQEATIDAQLALQLVASAAASVTPAARSILDIGCGAGNYTLKLMELLPGLDVTLLDLSAPMLSRASERVTSAGAGNVTAIQKDIRDYQLAEQSFDIVLAAAVLHHLRDDAQWKAVFANLHRALKPGGSLWIFDLVLHENSAVRELMWNRYGEYLASLKGSDYREKVFAYIEQEDTPRSLQFQLDLLREVGFSAVDVLHANGPFAAFGAIK